VLDYPLHQGVQLLVQDLNRLYHQLSPLHQYDFDWQGFEWIDCHDGVQSVLSFIRRSDTQTLVVIVNFTPVPRRNYRIGVPFAGKYSEILNSDSHYYGGSNMGNGMEPIEAEEMAWMERPYSIELTLPPLACLVFQVEQYEVPGEIRHGNEGTLQK
jgi:1,4-alpha-glucan branching enzyme